MTKHRFSVVIPTRNRADTLPFTLRTCLEQDFDDYEVVVSDNGSDSETQEVVEQVGHPRVRYVRTPQPLAISDSWDFAVAQASGEYVTVLGADDGLLPHALREIDRLLRLVDTPALRWECVSYTWPNLPATEHAVPNRLLIPLTQSGSGHALRRVEAGDVMQAAANSRISYACLPMIYCSAIHHGLLARLRERTGRVFQGTAPDMYSSWALAHVAGTYHSLDAPLGINALSGSSTGVAVIYLQGRSAIGQDFHALNAGARWTRHPSVPDLPVMAAYVADSFLQAREALFPEDADLCLDRKLLAMNCLRQVRCADQGEWQRAVEAVRLSLADDAKLLAWFAEQDDKAPRLSRRPPTPFGRRYGGTYLHL
jgi:Glycosyl transferase family 2